MNNIHGSFASNGVIRGWGFSNTLCESLSTGVGVNLVMILASMRSHYTLTQPFEYAGRFINCPVVTRP